MKSIALIISSLLSFSTFAMTDTSMNQVFMIAKERVVMYGLFRIGELGRAYNERELTQGQICGLAGQAEMSFQIFSSLGLSDQEISDQLRNLNTFGITLEVIRNRINVDIENCGLE